MKIYDISQEVFNCRVYPGDNSPQKNEMRRISKGDLYNLTNFSMCAHNGTHIDAPFHFIENGDTVEKISLYKTVGFCYVSTFNGTLSSDDADLIIRKAEKLSSESAKRILLKGNAIVTPEAARVFVSYGIDLIGVESQSIGETNHPMEVHKLLLQNDIVLLEGIELSDVNDGVYFLNAAPISLEGSDGAPCRAILIQF